MTDHRYKVGILGTGVISRTYAEDIRKFYGRKLELLSCADINPDAARQLASEFGIIDLSTIETAGMVLWHYHRRKS